MPTAEWLVVAWGGAVLAADLTVRRIPNVLSLGASVLALVFLLIKGMTVLGAGWLSALAGIGLALALTLPGYLTRLLGAGDVKLLFAIALLGGWVAVLISFTIAGLLCGIAALGLLLLARYDRNRLAGQRKLPFGAAMAAGLPIAIWLGA